jgi:microcystin-dependent protein
MTLYKWSQTASSDATADSTINWAEGQAPSSVNDSARAMMAATAKYRDDIAGAITTGGTSTAYTVTSYQVFDTLAHMNGQMIAFTPHATNANGIGVNATLNVDGLGAKTILSAPGAQLLPGTIIQGTPYVALYNNSNGVFYLQSLFGNPYNIPLGGGLVFFGATAPNSSFVLPYGQAISRTTYATLFSLVGATYGSGDGSTTFNVPDLRGRAPIGKDDMGGSAASRVGLVIAGTVLGAVGGSETHTLTAAQIPTLTSTGSNSISVTATTANVITGGTTSFFGGGSNSYVWQSSNNVTLVSTGTNSISVTTSGTSGATHNNTQPSIICNYIMRII